MKLQPELLGSKKRQRWPKAKEIIRPPADKDLPFDTEHEITAEDWAHIKNLLTPIPASWEEEDRLPFFTFVLQMKLLFPDRFSELRIGDEHCKQILESINTYRKEKSWEKFASRAYVLKLVFPEKRAELGLDETTWDGLIKQLDQFRMNQEWDNYAQHARYMKGLFPDRISELKLDQEVWRAFSEKIQAYSLKKLSMTEILFMESVQFLFPEKRSALAPTQQTWKEIRATLSKFRAENRWASFLLLAFCMKCLAAQDIKVTEYGMEIIMPPTRLESHMILPDRDLA